MSIKLNWDVTLNGGSIDVVVYQDADQDGTFEANTVSHSVTDGTGSVELDGVTMAGDHYLDISVSDTGASGPRPQYHGFTVEAATPVLSVDATRETQIDLSWTDTGATGYDLYRSETSGSSMADYTKIADTTGQTYTDTGLENGEKYYYVVTEDASTEISNEVEPVTTLPSATINSVDESVEDELTVNWSNNDNSTDGTIEVYQSQDGTLGNHLASYTDLTTTSHTQGSLRDGNSYHYTVRRVTDHASVDSAQQKGTTILPEPTGLTGDTSTQGEITWSWTDNSDHTDGFRVFTGDSESWEDDSFETWNTPAWNQVTDRVFEGTYAGHYSSGGGIDVLASKTLYPNGKQLDFFEYTWQETSGSNGGAVSLVDSAGAEVVATATDNPSWEIKDANGWRQVYNGDGYDRWVTFRIEFDWGNSQFSIRFKDHSSGAIYEESGISLINATDISSVEIRNYSSDSYTSGSNFDMWVDGISHGTIGEVASTSTTGTITGLEDGERYLGRVEIYTENAVSYSTLQDEITLLPATTPTLDSSTEDQIGLSWTTSDNSTDGEWEIYRSTDGTLGTNIHTTSDETTTSYTDTGLTDGQTYYYTLRRVTDHTNSDGSDSATTVMPAPTSVSASVVSNTEVGLSWIDNSDSESGFDIDVNENGSGYSDLHTTGANVESYTATDGDVLADSKYIFRVRALGPDTNSDWVAASAVYTEPKAPYQSTARKGSSGEDLVLEWVNESRIEDGVEIQYREDFGTGYQSWGVAETTTAGANSTTYVTGGPSWFVNDSRYQFRLRTVAPDGDTSDWMYHDYGNQYTFLFSDGFESADTSGWDGTNTGSLSNTEVTSSPTQLTDSTVPEGSYVWVTGEDGYLIKNLGDLSSESHIHARFKWQMTGNGPSSSGARVEWYDGSTWTTLGSWDYGWDTTGWIETTLPVDASLLSSDNRIRITGINGDGTEHFAVDEVVVSNHLHEYTKPGPVSSLTVDDTVQREFGLSWSDDSTFEEKFEVHHKLTTDASYTKDFSAGGPGTESYTITGLTDGETYDVRVRVTISQARRGGSLFYCVADTSTTGTTILPAPTLDGIDGSVEDQLTISYTLNDNNSGGDVEIYRSQDGSIGTVATTITNLTTGNYTDGSLQDGEKYYYIVRRNTSDVSEDSSQDSDITILPAPGNLSFNEPYLTQVDITWTKDDDSVDGSVVVYKSDDSGSLGTAIATLAYSATSYDDRGVETGADKYYTIRRETNHTYTDSSGSITTSGIVGPKTTMSFRSRGDWNDGQEDQMRHNAIDGGDEEHLIQGLSQEWPILEDAEAYYSFYNTNGVLTDHAKDNDGTALGNITYGHTGINGSRAWYFNGSTDSRVDLPHLGIFGDEPVTMVINFKPEDTTDPKMLMTMGGDDPYEQLALMAGENCDRYYVSPGNASNGDGLGYDYFETNTVSSYTNNWVQGSIVYDPDQSEIRAYHQGTNIINHSLTEDMRIHNQRFRIGSGEIGRTSSGNEVHPLQSYVSDALIINKVLSDSQIQALSDSINSGRFRTEVRQI